MAEIFKTTFEEACDHEDDEPLQDMPPMAFPGDNQPERKIPAKEPRVPKLPSQLHPAPEPKVETPPKTLPQIKYAAATRKGNAARQRNLKLTIPTPNKKDAKFSKLVSYAFPTPKSRLNPRKISPLPKTAYPINNLQNRADRDAHTPTPPGNPPSEHYPSTAEKRTPCSKSLQI